MNKSKHVPITKYVITQNNHKIEKNKPGLVAYYDLWPGNGTGLFLRK